jgi:hypothetical protein
MHVQAAGRHDYFMEPLFRLDGGPLEHHYDRMFYDIGQGADIAWHASVAPNWPARGSRTARHAAQRSSGTQKTTDPAR